ncbi:MAG: hypothetical protein LBK43_08835 [Treponema sp.]|jgi:hypothetical protein|nr:hypothetical protein [Treponema sp.]
MGLLYKAVSQNAIKLDDKGKMLRDRILRIAQKGASPYTVLSLLKTYGSFHCGICLRLIDGMYTGYASVGMGIEKTVIPPERFPPGLNGSGSQESPVQRMLYYNIGSPAMLSISSMDPQTSIWAFPLDDKQPCLSMLLLAEEASPHSSAVQSGDSPFNPRLMARILMDISVVLRAPEKESCPESTSPDKVLEPHVLKHQTQALNPPEARGIDPLDLHQEICRYYASTQSLVQGILFAFSGDKAQILPMVAPWASLIRVSATYLLALFQKPLDRELLAHRLSNGLGLSTVLTFEADTPDALLSLIGPYR